MVRSSAAEQTPMRPAMSANDGRFAEDERFYEDVLSGRQASEADMDQFVDALAAELEQDIASMSPVDMRTGQVYKQPAGPRKTNQAYDPWDDQALDEFMAEFERDGVDPVVDQFGVLPPHEDEEAEPAASHGRRRLMTAAAAAVMVVAVGFAGWAFFGGSTGFREAVVVKAPEGPYKVKPDPNAQEVVASSEGTSVYDTVGGAPPKSEERLVARSGDVPELPAVTPHVSRITLPDGQEVEAELPTGFDPNETGPRRVRTVLVRPDGSLIETPADKPANATASATPAPTDGAGQIIARSETAGDAASGDAAADDTEGGAGLPPLASSNQTVASDTAPAAPQGLPPSNLTDASGQRMPINLAAVPSAPVDTTASVPTQGAAPLPLAKPAAPSAAASSSSGPLDLTAAAAKAQPAAPAQVASLPAAAPAAATPAASGGSGAYVQLSSQRSEDAARSAFAALQRKFPSILGSAVADIQQADLGSKGVYYRARVGAPTKEAAVALCEQLRSAGGDCLIAR